MANRQILRTFVMIALIAAGLVWLPAEAEATVTYSLDFVFSGFQPTNSGPWATISFTTSGTNTTVTMTALAALGPTEFITFWGFNSTAAVSTLGVPTSLSAPPANATISKGDAAFKADGDGNYDILVDFQQAGGAGRLTAGESVTFTITGATETNFSPLSTGSEEGAYNTAIHLQGIPGAPGSTCSGWIGNNNASAVGTGTGDPCVSTPEPNSLTTLVFSLLGLLLVVGGSRRLGLGL